MAQTAESHKINDSTVNEDDEGDDGGGCFIAGHVTGCRSAMMAFYSRHKSYVKTGLLAVLVALYFAYFGYALYYEFGDEGFIRLLWITCVVVAILMLSLLFRYLRPNLKSILSSGLITSIRQHRRRVSWFVALTCQSIQLLVN